MLDLLSICGVILAFLIGYQFSRKAGWGVILIAPILGPSSFTFISSPLLPLTTYRVAFAITIGVVLRNHYRHGIPLISILKSTFVKIVVVFSLFVIVISFEDRLKNIIFTYIPNLILAFALCYILIRDEKDLNSLIKIFVWQGFLIGIFILFEFYTDFNINVIIRQTIAGADMEMIRPKGLYPTFRSGQFRPMGIDGNAVHTSYRLTFLFPLALWVFLRRKAFGLLPLLGVACGLILLQVRAAFVGIFVSIFVLVFCIAIFGRFKWIRKLRMLTALFIFLAVPTLSLVFFTPSIIDRIEHMVSGTLSGGNPAKKEFSLDSKLSRIPDVIDYFKQKPLLGYGSPRYAYIGVMGGRDLPAPLIYLLAGGIPLCGIYLIMIWYMPFSVFQLSRTKGLNFRQRELLIFICSGFVGGVVVTFSNLPQTHFMIMYMLYISIYRVYMIKKINNIKETKSN